MARVLYNGKRIIPAPLVNISKSYQKSGNGEIIGKTYSLTLTGTLVAWMGSPSSSGIFYTGSDYPDNEAVADANRLGAIQRKQEALRDLFSDEGKSFEIQSSASDTAVRCNPRITEISFSEGIWYERCEYTINLETDELYGTTGISQEDTFSQYIADANESWSIDTNEDAAETYGIPKTYSVSHTVSAQGKRFYDETGTLVKDPWKQAQTYVLSKLGFDATMLASSGVNNIPSYYSGYNHVRNENLDEQGGSYSVTETWVLSSGNATESFNIQTADQLESAYKSVTINGEVRGYDERNVNMGITTSKYDNANSKFVTASGLAFIRAQQFSGLTLNSTPLSQTIGRNPTQGLITYDFQYNTRPSNLITGARSEKISIVDNLGGEMFASVFVLGRTKGPVLQDLSTKSANTRNLNIELILSPETGTASQLINSKKPTNNPLYSGVINDIITAADPTNIAGVTTVFQDQTQENWDIINFSYSLSTSWTYE